MRAIVCVCVHENRASAFCPDVNTSHRETFFSSFSFTILFAYFAFLKNLLEFKNKVDVWL